MSKRGLVPRLVDRTRYSSSKRVLESFVTSFSSSRSLATANIGHQSDNEEDQLAQKLTEAKAKMIQMGYHGPSLWTQVICWGDHDQFQHVNNVHYLRFVESARMKFAEKGMAALLPLHRQQEIAKGTGQSFILHSVSLRYKRPVVYPDTLIVGTQPLSPLQKDRFSLKTGLYSIQLEAIVATSEQLNVCYDYKNLSKIEMPQDFREALEKLMGNPSG